MSRALTVGLQAGSCLRAGMMTRYGKLSKQIVEVPRLQPCRLIAEVCCTLFKNQQAYAVEVTCGLLLRRFFVSLCVYVCLCVPWQASRRASAGGPQFVESIVPQISTPQAPNPARASASTITNSTVPYSLKTSELPQVHVNMILMCRRSSHLRVSTWWWSFAALKGSWTRHAFHCSGR